jgi:four helix bundle protein
MIEKKYEYKKLDVYKESKNLVKMVYRFIERFPKVETYALCDQLRRAVISVPSNIAEGSGRTSSKDQAHFLNIAYGSIMETYAQFDMAHDLGYISDDIFNKLESAMEEVSKMISVMASLRTISPSYRNKN